MTNVSQGPSLSRSRGWEGEDPGNGIERQSITAVALQVEGAIAKNRVTAVTPAIEKKEIHYKSV